MQEKSADEILSGEGDESVLAGVLIVSRSEGDGFSTEARQSVVRDGYPVGVAAEVVVGFL